MKKEERKCNINILGCLNHACIIPVMRECIIVSCSLEDAHR